VEIILELNILKERHLTGAYFKMLSSKMISTVIFILACMYMLFYVLVDSLFDRELVHTNHWSLIFVPKEKKMKDSWLYFEGG
jgi:hypothetical protein